jgi:hypothetical protein
MVLKDDIGLEDTCCLALCGLVGRFTYENLQKDTLSVWLEKAWKPLLGYVPELFPLTKGWLGFLCRYPEDVALLLSKRWLNGRSSLMVKRWSVAFNPETYYLSKRHFWVLLPGLPWKF